MRLRKREIKIIQIIKEHPYVTSREIADYLKVSEKTVRSDINGIICDFGVNIRSKRGVGYYLNAEDYNKLDSIFYNDITIPSGKEEREKELIKLFVKNCFPESLEELCDQWYISEKTLTNDLNNIKIILSKYNLTIEKNRRSSVELVGDEFEIRNLCNDYDIYKHEGAVDRSFIRTVITEEAEKINYSFSDIVVELLTNHIQISIARIKNGFLINSPIDQINLENTIEFDLSTDILNRISKEYDIIFPLYEREYISYHVLGKEFRKQTSNSSLTNETEKLVNELLLLINKTFDIDVICDLEFRIALGLHLEQLLKRMQYGTQIKNPLLSDIKLKYPYAYTMAKVVAILIHKKTGEIVEEDEIGYIALSLQQLLENDNKEKRRKYILLVCPFGQTSANLFKYKYLEVFSDQIESIETSSIEDVKKYDLNRFDYIFTLAPLKIKTSVPILNANYFLNETTINEIKNRLKTENKGSSYFENIKFIDNLNAKDREALKKICEIVKKDNNIKDDLYERVKEREKIASTDYAYKTAVPHPDRLLVDNTYICMAILEKPIMWELQEVCIVVLVLIGRSDKDKVQEFYQLFAQFLMDENKVDKLIRSRSKEKLLELINKMKED
ncbi:BglG family transcription antiterminator [Holdemanella biformis]|uniref:BglG family transcription antiterminator n=1 Tax=Holdemanella biformis TaxID=1735 RepID=UPI0026DAEE0A|nr:BglG family transcription antiterminator [Holdemanella biformis]